MDLWQAIVLGLVEGITEYLPVSSTGHLILASSLMRLDDPEVKASVDTFTIVVQGGAILAVLGLYWPSVLRMLKGLAGKDPGGFRLAVNLFVAFLPAAVLGVLLDDWIEARLFFIGPVVAALALGGVFMLVVEQWRRGRFGLVRRGSQEELTEVTLRQALFIGLMQCIAMWPGTSRSMMTIVGGVIAGLSPKRAAEFSFLLGLPTLGGATVYKMLKNLKHAEETGTPNFIEQLGWTPILVGIVVATISAAIAVKWLVGFLNKHGLAPFGWYRIAIAAVLLALALAGIVRVAPETTGELDDQSRQVEVSNWPEGADARSAAPRVEEGAR